MSLWDCAQLKRNAYAMHNSKSSIQSRPYDGALGCPNQVQIKFKSGTLNPPTANVLGIVVDNAPSLSRFAPKLHGRRAEFSRSCLLLRAGTRLTLRHTSMVDRPVVRALAIWKPKQVSRAPHSCATRETRTRQDFVGDGAAQPRGPSSSRIALVGQRGASDIKRNIPNPPGIFGGA